MADRQSQVLEYIDSVEEEEKVVTKEVFNTWLTDPVVLDLLEEVEVETSTKYELFDALDVDSGGELSIAELVSGLMQLRGPISKTDIVATRLKVAYIAELMEEICRKMGVHLSRDSTVEAKKTIRVESQYDEEGEVHRRTQGTMRSTVFKP